MPEFAKVSLIFIGSLYFRPSSEFPERRKDGLREEKMEIVANQFFTPENVRVTNTELRRVCSRASFSFRWSVGAIALDTILAIRGCSISFSGNLQLKNGDRLVEFFTNFNMPKRMWKNTSPAVLSKVTSVSLVFKLDGGTCGSLLVF